MNHKNKRIQRKITSEDRLFTIIDSMRGIDYSNIKLIKESLPQPELEISIIAKNGIVDYSFLYSGIHKINEFTKKFNTHITLATERGGKIYTPSWKRYEGIINKHDLSPSESDLNIIMTDFLIQDGDPLLNVPSFIRQIRHYKEEGHSPEQILENTGVPFSLLNIIDRVDNSSEYSVLNDYILHYNAMTKLTQSESPFLTTHEKLISGGFIEDIAHAYILIDNKGEVSSLAIDSGNNNASITHGLEAGKKALMSPIISSTMENSNKTPVEVFQKPN